MHACDMCKLIIPWSHYCSHSVKFPATVQAKNPALFQIIIQEILHYTDRPKLRLSSCVIELVLGSDISEMVEL